MDAKQVWQAALERIRQRISPGAYTAWFQGTVGLDLQQSELRVGVSNTFASEHLRQRFQETARVAVSEVIGQSAQIAFVVSDAAAPAHGAASTAGAPVKRRTQPSRGARQGGRQAVAVSAGPARAQQVAALCEPYPAPPLPSHNGRSSASHRARARATAWHAQPALDGLVAEEPAPTMLPRPDRRIRASEVKPSGEDLSPRPAVTAAAGEAICATPTHELPPPLDLSPRYVFESFVVGMANRLAYAAAQEVANAPGQQYNPLLIYGKAGLGKTHLLQAIGHQARLAGLSVAYVTAERFTNEIIDAIRHRTTDEFRRRYRAADLLLVDDIHFIAGKESTEEEFFHTFNALHEANKQIVLTSDRVPQAVRHLHDRLRSRFAWGLLADIQPPDFEHRLEILRAKVHAQQLGVPEEVLVLLARPECESIRMLEGSLTRVIAYARMLGQTLDKHLAAQALGALGMEQPLAPVGPLAGADVVRAVAHHYGVTTQALCSKSRERLTAWARQVAMYLLREETTDSLLQIGQQLGGRDHTTVMHGCARVSEALRREASAQVEIEAIRASLRA